MLRFSRAAIGFPRGRSPAPPTCIRLKTTICSMRARSRSSRGARNNWHAHPVAQLLVVTAGEALYKEEGKPAVRVRTGESAYTPAGVRHWHGAVPDAEMTHVAVTLKGPDGPVEWGRPVTDEEYAQAAAEAV